MADEETSTPTPPAPETPVVDTPTEAEPSRRLSPEQREELVEIEHDGIDTTSEVTRAAYLDTWQDLGWRIKGVLEENPNTGELVRAPDPDEPVIVQRTDGEPLENPAAAEAATTGVPVQEEAQTSDDDTSRRR